MLEHIRNFSIIAHIDHGKSTLADRMLEITKTIETRKMRAQVLDAMDLERERGITIKMQPVRMAYAVGGTSYTLNLIDTPGHIDFGYEVSRALTAVEGVLLLVDAAQGVQAQTLATLGMAREAGCVIIPVLTKIDSPAARVPEIREELSRTLKVAPETVLAVSGKTGEGVEALLAAIVERIPPPKTEYVGQGGRALVFDFSYSEHRGIVDGGRNRLRRNRHQRAGHRARGRHDTHDQLHIACASRILNAASGGVGVLVPGIPR
jgi:GTP-binding protein LepA